MAFKAGFGEWLDKYDMVQYKFTGTESAWVGNNLNDHYWVELPFSFPYFDRNYMRCFVDFRGTLTFSRDNETTGLATDESSVEVYMYASISASGMQIQLSYDESITRFYTKQYVTGSKKAIAIRVESTVGTNGINILEYILFDNGDLQVRRNCKSVSNNWILSNIATDQTHIQKYTHIQNSNRDEAILFTRAGSNAFISNFGHYESDSIYIFDTEKRVLSQLFEGNVTGKIPKCINIYTENAIVENGGVGKYRIGLENGLIGCLNYNCTGTGYDNSGLFISPDGVNKVRIRSNIGIVSTTDFTYIPIEALKWDYENAPNNVAAGGTSYYWNTPTNITFSQVISNVRAIYLCQVFIVDGAGSYCPTVARPNIYMYYSQTVTGSLSQITNTTVVPAGRDPKYSILSCYYSTTANLNVGRIGILPYIGASNQWFSYYLHSGYLKIANVSVKQR